MSLSHALLTALLEHPCSGSELANRFDRSIGYFWPATHQQIYRELAGIEKSGWIESLPPESGRGRKRGYRVLPAGEAELKRWVVEPQNPRPVRDELSVRLRAEAVVGPTDLQVGIEQRMLRHQARLAHYLDLERRDFSNPDPDRAQRLRRLVLQAGIDSERRWIGFCQAALSILAEGNPS